MVWISPFWHSSPLSSSFPLSALFLFQSREWLEEERQWRLLNGHIWPRGCVSLEEERWKAAVVPSFVATIFFNSKVVVGSVTLLLLLFCLSANSLQGCAGCRGFLWIGGDQAKGTSTLIPTCMQKFYINLSKGHSVWKKKPNSHNFFLLKAMEWQTQKMKHCMDPERINGQKRVASELRAPKKQAPKESGAGCW